ncbi:nuclease [Deinococcus sp. KNUC1210]|uniref:DNA double-strand break repair nuclease NurA n=1 Tax=Deinococcus sp. KNUC1210 TaxID=2917691 RepID=UPI001EF04022|nr:DNA double-strand break repair nuclease NurA [Deinococcus sp. KNUC1210]ULH15919.1 nuclease [Deinococcus sp. KNUC1210]
MRIRLDPWPIDTQGGQLSLTPFSSGELIDVETPRWAAIAPRDVPKRLETVYVVDGKPRMEARLLIEDDEGSSSFAGYGAFVVGAVKLCPHGSRPAELEDVRASRILAHGPGLSVQAARLSPRHPQTGALEYMPSGFQDDQPTAPATHLQQLMLRAEQELSHGLASQVPFDEDDDRERLTSLTIQDGTLRGRNMGGAVVGCVKTMQTMYLPPDRISLLSELKPGERTPILHLKYGNNRVTRFTWYVRLCEAPAYLHPLAGVIRLEMYAPEESDFLPPIVRAVASLSGRLLCRLGSAAHKDSRAPQNLIPTAALEQAMSRTMGDARLVERRIRTHIMREMNVPAEELRGAAWSLN